MARTWRRRAAVACAVGCGGAAAAAAAHPGMRREISFWTRAAPIALHYHAVDWWAYAHGWSEQRRAERFRALHMRYAPRVHALVLELRGFFIKVAQLASTRDDFLAPEYLAFCKLLQNHAPCAMSAEEARAAAERELGRPLSEVFSEWGDHPVGSATIAQVHRARTAEGREVAVKLQYPGCEDLFRTDMRLSLDFCRLFMRQHVPFMEEFQRMFDSEFDFRREADQLRDISARLRRTQHARDVFVPDAIPQLCTRRLLTMDLVPGEKLVDGLRRAARAEALRRGEDPELYEERMKGVPPPARWRISLYTFLLHLGDAAANAPRRLWNCVCALLGSPEWRVGLRRSNPPPNIRAVLDCVSEVHAWQLFDEGVFNADPHPGNIILMPDGRLGLVDFGQVGELGVPERRRLAELLVLLADRAPACEVADALEGMGLRFRRRDDDIMLRYARFHFAKEWSNPEVTMGMNPMAFMDWLHAANPVDEMPRQWVLANRMLMVLCGFRTAFGMPSNMAELFAPHARRWLSRSGAAAAA
eukprot:TRINITY_DN56365_c0_g1_i1.p1 TRINITY_DN56365_c0_g1~~TRINITY_DN56365_c0_g1_i1.p1  ORF type:complete len:557 (+),score=190.61 TRINITY_DN56365_c0_g1_i1:82-1671(+)